MRLDKYLKVSRLIKRRTVANEVADAGRILINGKTAKASQAVKAGDIIGPLRRGAPHQGRGPRDVRDHRAGQRAGSRPRRPESRVNPA